MSTTAKREAAVILGATTFFVGYLLYIYSKEDCQWLDWGMLGACVIALMFYTILVAKNLARWPLIATVISFVLLLAGLTALSYYDLKKYGFLYKEKANTRKKLKYDLEPDLMYLAGVAVLGFAALFFFVALFGLYAIWKEDPEEAATAVKPVVPTAPHHTIAPAAVHHTPTTAAPGTPHNVVVPAVAVPAAPAVTAHTA